MLKAFTICTAEHYDMAAALKKGISKHSQIEIDVVNCPMMSGDFMSPEFYDVQTFKIETLLKFLNEYETVVYFDSDIVIFGDVIKSMASHLDHYDLAFQKDRDCVCAGMFICKRNDAVMNFFNTVLNRLICDKNQYVFSAADQTIINEMLKADSSEIKVGMLNENQFTTFGNINVDKQLWEEGDVFTLNEEVLAFHANFTIGINNKIKLMEYVKSLKEEIL